MPRPAVKCALNWCKKLESGLPRPDCVIFLRRQFTVADNGTERYENEYASNEIEKVLLDMTDPSWVLINCDDKNYLMRILKATLSTISGSRFKPLNYQLF